MRKVLQIALAAAVVAMLSTAAFAQTQKFEASPYAGGIFPGEYNHLENLKREGLYGARGGYFFTKHIEAEGNFGYINHFEFQNAPHQKTRAWLYDVNGTYHFFPSSLGKVTPYVTAGVGGVSVNTVDAERRVLPIGNTGRSITLNNRDAFFTVNYGGGIKIARLWGPLGFRADVRGRTIPNFRGEQNSWVESTAGLLVSWGGER